MLPTIMLPFHLCQSPVNLMSVIQVSSGLFVLSIAEGMSLQGSWQYRGSPTGQQCIMEAGAAKGGAMTQNSGQHFHSTVVFQVHHTSEVLCNRTQDLGETLLMVQPVQDHNPD
jgi:hypothetical protein